MSDEKDTTILSQNSHLLRRALNQQAQNETDDLPVENKREILLLVRGMVERIEIKEGDKFKLGRYELSSNTHEIDLTPYGAADRGVSRDHAQIHVQDDTVYITDLGSTNGTFLQGEKIEPNTPTIIKKGSELLLGRLALQVMFR